MRQCQGSNRHNKLPQMRRADISIGQAQMDAQDQEPQATEREPQLDNGQLLGQAVRQRVAQAMQPVLANVQRQMAEIAQQHVRLGLQRVPMPAQEQTPAFEDDRLEGWREDERLPETPGQPKSFTRATGRPQDEKALRLVLDTVLDTVFSDALRATVQQQSEKTLLSILAAGRTALVDEEARSKVQRRTEQVLDGMLDELFSSAMRNYAQRSGGRVVHQLVAGDVASARREGEHALQSLAHRWGGVVQEHWEKVVQSLLKAVAEASEERARGRAHERATRSSSQSVEEQRVPQTVLRSDKRAQTIWKKAHDRAVKRDGAGRSADRAGYEALKQEYEKKGNRWVKKGAGARSDSSTGHEPKTPGKSTNDTGPARAGRKEARSQAQAGQKGGGRRRRPED